MPKYIDLLRKHKAVPARRPAKEPESMEGEEDLLHPLSAALAAKPEKTCSISTERRSTSGDSPVDDKTAKEQTTTDPDFWLNQCVRILHSFLKAASNRKIVPIEKLWSHLKPQISTVIQEPRQLSALELKISENTIAIRDTSEKFGDMLEKSMNMMLLSIKIGQQLKMPEQDILSLLLAGMLHHAGLARVPIAIRHKSSALTRDERQSIRNATCEGVEYLHACGIADANTLLAIEQSQERIDGSGPQGLCGDEISYMGRIVGLLSFFEALIHYRPYRQRMLPRDAIRDIILHHKAAFDTGLLKALIDAASLYPIGTYVQLNSGDIGQVIHVHPRLPLRPTVLLKMDRKGHPVTQREVNLQLQTNLLVERCMYPEDIDKPR